MTPKTRTFLALGLPLLLTDCATKAVAVAELLPHTPYEVYGDIFRLTLVYNTGAAMSLTLGEWSRLGFGTLAVAAVLFLLHLLSRTRDDDRIRAAALALVTAGALGNLWDRLRWDRGVVDFIDLGLGDYRFWIFNAADVGIMAGGVLLAVTFWRESEERRSKRRPPPSPTAEPPARGRTMPITYRLDRESRFIETRCNGDLKLAEVLAHFRELEADPSLPERLDVLLDLDGVTSLPDASHLRHVTVAVDHLTNRLRWGACAIVASSDVLFGMSRMFEVFTEHLFARIRVFRTREDAELWLADTRAAGAIVSSPDGADEPTLLQPRTQIRLSRAVPPSRAAAPPAVES